MAQFRASSARLCALPLALFLLAKSAYGTRVTPVQKVIELLGNMKEKGLKEMQDEEVAFSKYSQFCRNAEAEKTESIAEAKAAMGKAESRMNKSMVDIESLSGKITELKNRIGDNEQKTEDATQIRHKNREDNMATIRDYSESISALKRAIDTLSRQDVDRVQALLQLHSWKLPPLARRHVLAFLQSSSLDDEFSDRSAPEANAYEFQSGGVVEMLKKLEEKFTKQLRALEKEEQNYQHSHQLQVQTLTDEIENYKSDVSRKVASRGAAEESKGDSKAELDNQTDVHKSESDYLHELKTLCTVKSRDFEARQQLRGEELDAIQKAVDILSSGSVSGAADKHLPSMFLQLRAASSRIRGRIDHFDEVHDVMEFLQGQADKLRSHELSLFASRIRMSDSPFDKVKRMIRDMVVRLMEQAQAEAEEQGFCSKELKVNKMTRDEKSGVASGLRSELEGLSSKIQQLSMQITDLNDQVHQIAKEVTEAVKDRTEEKTTNEATIADAKDAQQAVANAVEVLNQFYSGAKSAEALIQMKSRKSRGPGDDAPDTFSKPYTGMQSESGGVLGMLEVIQTDFSRLETETITAEEVASNDHKKFIQDSKMDTALKKQSITSKKEKQGRLSRTKTETATELQNTEEELKAANDYYEELKPRCVSPGVSYEERVRMREEEIQSLQEALEMLQG